MSEETWMENEVLNFDLIMHRLPPKLRQQILFPPEDALEKPQNTYDIIKKLIQRQFNDEQINNILTKFKVDGDRDYTKDVRRCRNGKLGENQVAKQFSSLNSNFRFCASWGKWLHWNSNSGYWQIDETMRINSEIGETISELEIPGIRHSYKLINGIEILLRSQSDISSLDKDWDADPWLLTTPNGTIELKTGILRPTYKDDLITKITSVAPKSGPCPKWLSFLQDATNNDDDFISYLQRVSGYCLTGLTNEHALFFLYGSGGNGKGIFLNTITNIMGDYAKTADMSIFTESKYEQHSTGLAFLRGARLVTSQETESGKSWKESLIKALTSDDPITARFMRQDFFTFQKQCKILISGNHEPQLRNVDDAMRRRFNKLPFTFKPKVPNKFLLEELRSEYPQILSWMLDGCKSWQNSSLDPPTVVKVSTEQYMSDQFNFQHFLEDECEIYDNDPLKNMFCESTQSLFTAWCSWASKRHLPQGTVKTFSSELQKYGFIYKDKLPISRMRGYEGLKLKTKTPKNNSDIAISALRNLDEE